MTIHFAVKMLSLVVILVSKNDWDWISIQQNILIQIHLCLFLKIQMTMFKNAISIIKTSIGFSKIMVICFLRCYFYTEKYYLCIYSGQRHIWQHIICKIQGPLFRQSSSWCVVVAQCFSTLPTFCSVLCRHVLPVNWLAAFPIILLQLCNVYRPSLVLSVAFCQHSKITVGQSNHSISEKGLSNTLSLIWLTSSIRLLDGGTLLIKVFFQRRSPKLDSDHQNSLWTVLKQTCNYCIFARLFERKFYVSLLWLHCTNIVLVFLLAGSHLNHSIASYEIVCTRVISWCCIALHKTNDSSLSNHCISARNSLVQESYFTTV